jgi:hypothetical protein
VETNNIVTNFNKRTLTNLFLIGLSIFIGEAWQIVRYSDYMVNPWFNLDYPLYLGWYMFYVGRYVSPILMGIVVYRMARVGAPIRIAALIYSYYSGLCLLSFLYNFDKIPSVYLYAGVGLCVWAHWRFNLKEVRSKAAKFIVSKTVVVKKKESIGA